MCLLCFDQCLFVHHVYYRCVCVCTTYITLVSVICICIDIDRYLAPHVSVVLRSMSVCALSVMFDFLDGYCSTVQGLLDWFEVDLGFTKLWFIQTDLCVLCAHYQWCLFLMMTVLCMHTYAHLKQHLWARAHTHTHTHNRWQTHSLNLSLSHTHTNTNLCLLIPFIFNTNSNRTRILFQGLEYLSRRLVKILKRQL